MGPTHLSHDWHDRLNAVSCDNWLEEEEEEVEEEIEEEEIEVFAETAQENGSRCSAAHECQVA